MGKYKRLKIAHDRLQGDFEQLIRTLKVDGSLAPHCGMCNQVIEGKHSDQIRCAQVDANTALFRVKELTKHLGLKFKHTRVEEWRYVEREDTNE